MSIRHAVIITAAGSSARFNGNSSSSEKKEFAKIKGQSVLYWAALPFFSRDDTVAVVVTYKKELREETREALGKLIHQSKIPVFMVEGGDSRQVSVFNGLAEIERLQSQLNVNLVSIHDGARPFVSDKLIDTCIQAAVKVGGAVPVLPITDTIIMTDVNGFIAQRVNRDDLRRVQTPQTFVYPEIYKAHKGAYARPYDHYTDDSQIFLDAGGHVITVEGEISNIKITYPEDIK